jgi:transcriptional regulator with XRE-family HTH domain
VAAQIYALRKRNKWSQKALAKKAKMSQARISVMENPNHRKLNIGTLHRIAAVFDVALIVRFISFGELLDWTVSNSEEILAPRSFDQEFPKVALTYVNPVAKAGNVVVLTERLAELTRHQRLAGASIPSTGPQSQQATVESLLRSSGS